MKAIGKPDPGRVPRPPTLFRSAIQPAAATGESVTPMHQLKLASGLGENSDRFCRAVAGFLENRIRISVQYVADVPTQEREKRFDQGEIDILWFYRAPDGYEPNAAATAVESEVVPVPRSNRYQDRLVYFSDIVVRRDCPFRSLADLRAASWADDEIRSRSGYSVVYAYLAEFGEPDPVFGAIVETGSQTASLEMVASGRVDASAIDSTVLEGLLAERPELTREIRVIGISKKPLLARGFANEEAFHR